MALYMDIMLYFIEKIHVYGCNLSILWSIWKIRKPKTSTIVKLKWYFDKNKWSKTGFLVIIHIILGRKSEKSKGPWER